MFRLVPSVLLGVALVSACGSGSTTSEFLGETAQDWTVEIEHEGLVGPTQLLALDDGAFIVATINGGEDAAEGQVLELDRDSGDSSVLVDSLDKPTGIAVVDGELWIMERDRLTRGPIGEGDRTIVADELPNNGRSEGTLTVTPEGHILFNTSGSRRGATVVDGSGRLFIVDPEGGEPVEIAEGFKNAYAHAYDASDRLWSVEMSDGRFDDVLAADELVEVALGQNHGWPTCVGNNRPVNEFDTTANDCASVPASQALFAPGATPTSVVVSPFDENTLLVALWNEGRVVAISTQVSGEPVEPADVATGLSGPQHLFATTEAIYLTEFGTGRILKLAKS